MNSSSLLVDWLLDSFELQASLFHVGRYCGGWHASTQGLSRASFHLVLQVKCWLHVEGQPPCALQAGDAVFLLRDLAYRLSDEPSAAAAACQPRQPMAALQMQAEDGVGLVCGFFHFAGGLSALIIDALPDYLLLRAGEPSQRAAQSLFGLILEECQRAPAPSQQLLERLSHLLFLYVLRHQVLDAPALGGLVALARDGQFAALLERMIQAPQLPWTLEDMAACAGLSRSAFFKRFNETCGQSPGQVLLALRMDQARRLLEADQSVAEVAVAVGYQSVAAFTRAFHRSTGQQPGAYRAAHRR
ncbi:MAG: RCS-specific HTH-type transcriptional activator RclR [Pseudomonas citronellolis]|nr:MAG: RCS-specific HTH-type transcriptional activator RclR [Pseudomonas citronellolis]